MISLAKEHSYSDDESSSPDEVPLYVDVNKLEHKMMKI